MASAEDLTELADHLIRTTRLEPSEARRVIQEVLAYLSESPQEFVTRRHGELQREGHPNVEIYRRLSQELDHRRFPAPRFSERQIRRLTNSLRPRGRPQERVLTVLPFLAAHGPNLADLLVDAADPFTSGHGVLEL